MLINACREIFNSRVDHLSLDMCAYYTSSTLAAVFADVSIKTSACSFANDRPYRTNHTYKIPIASYNEICVIYSHHKKKDSESDVLAYTQKCIYLVMNTSSAVTSLLASKSLHKGKGCEQ